MGGKGGMEVGEEGEYNTLINQTRESSTFFVTDIPETENVRPVISPDDSSPLMSQLTHGSS